MKALVIGGSGTIGTAIVRQLLNDGYEVIVHYHSANIDDLVTTFEGEAVTFVQADLSTSSLDVSRFDWIQNLDCLIYVAGQAVYGQLQDMTESDMDATYYVHVKNLIVLCQYFVDQLRQRPHGRIIVISSIWGETGASMETIYSSMKAAQLGFVRALSKELAQTTVTVNAITPGFVAGRMAEKWSEDELKDMLTELPQQRLIQPEEIAHACAHLYHPMSQSITGAVQRINGGWYV